MREQGSSHVPLNSRVPHLLPFRPLSPFNPLPPRPGCHMLLNLRHPELEERGRRLTAKYLPMETDPHLPYEEKFRCMVEWCVLLLPEAPVHGGMVGGCCSQVHGMGIWDRGEGLAATFLYMETGPHLPYEHKGGMADAAAEATAGCVVDPCDCAACVSRQAYQRSSITAVVLLPLTRNRLLESVGKLAIKHTQHSRAIVVTLMWTAAHELLLESGITRADVTQSVAAANTAFRDGFCDMLALLEAQGVPLLIFSAGLADVIEELLHQQLPRSFSNVRVVSNRMQFDESGRLIAFPGRIIHVLNKNEHALELAALEEATAGTDSHSHGNGSTTAVHTDPASPTQVLTMAPQGVDREAGADTVTPGAITAAEELAEVRSRTNVILLGDHLGDLGMSEGVSISNQISVGFLNHDVERQLGLYKRSFDIVVLDDGPMDVVIAQLNDVLSF
ncbi:unnamed protein product [Closterium sp. NIES-54]